MRAPITMVPLCTLFIELKPVVQSKRRVHAYYLQTFALIPYFLVMIHWNMCNQSTFPEMQLKYQVDH